mgnify:CR=1 FL=1
MQANRSKQALVCVTCRLLRRRHRLGKALCRKMYLQTRASYGVGSTVYCRACSGAPLVRRKAPRGAGGHLKTQHFK